MQSEVMPEVDLEALFEQEIPCHRCGAGARFRSLGDGCPNRIGQTPPFYKCLKCLIDWTARSQNSLSAKGFLRCWNCERKFPDIPSFSDYREF